MVFDVVICARWRLSVVCAQARIAWQMLNYAEATAAAHGRRLLRLNLDETSVCLHPGRRRGAIFLTKSSLRTIRGQRVPKWKRRCCMTHIGLISEHQELHHALPQVLVAN